MVSESPGIITACNLIDYVDINGFNAIIFLKKGLTVKRKNILLITIALFILTGGLYFAAELYIKGKAEKKIERLVLKADEYVKIKYGKVTFCLLKNDLEISDLTLTIDNENKLTVEKTVINKFDSKSKIPSYLDISLQGIDIVTGKNESYINRFFSFLGYRDKMPLNLKLDYKYTKETGIFNINALEIFSENAGKLTFSFNFSNLTFENISFLDGLFSEDNPVLIEGATVKLTDNSITGKSLYTISQLIKMDLTDFKKLLDLQVDFYVKQINSNMSAESIAKIKTYIAEPDEIVFIASPAEPVPLYTFYINYNKPFKLLNILEFQVK